MMDIKTIGIGTRLELELFNSKGEKQRPLLVSQFEGMLSQNEIEVVAPIYEGKIYPVHTGTIIDVCYEKNGDMYLFQAKSMERKYKGKIAVIILEVLTNPKKIQRRAYYRLNVLLDVACRNYDSILLEPEDRGDYIQCLTKDISGGGVCLVLDERIPEGTFVDCRIPLGGIVEFTGKVVRVIPFKHSGITKYETGIEFTKISNKSRENIISFIFQKQRNMLNKGWSKI